MTIFIIIVGISIFGLSIIAWLLISEKKREDSSVETLTPEDLSILSTSPSPIEDVKSEAASYQRDKKDNLTLEEAFKEKPSLFSKFKIEKTKKEGPFFNKKYSPEPSFSKEPDEKYTVPEKSGQQSLPKKKSLELTPTFHFKRLKFGFGKKESKQNNIFDNFIDTPFSKNIFKKIFGQLRKKNIKNSEDELSQEEYSFPNLKEKFEETVVPENNLSEEDHVPLLKDLASGTLSLKTIPDQASATANKLSHLEEKSIEEEVITTTELAELKQRYEKLNVMFQEKSTEFDKIQQLYNYEVGHRKDFNKVKDILEKELKEVKDRAKNIQAELNKSKNENENYQKRIAQLDDKIIKLGKAVLAKEQESSKTSQEKIVIPNTGDISISDSGVSEKQPPATIPNGTQEGDEISRKYNVTNLEESLGISSPQSKNEPKPEHPTLALPDDKTEGTAATPSSFNFVKKDSQKSDANAYLSLPSDPMASLNTNKNITSSTETTLKNQQKNQLFNQKSEQEQSDQKKD